MPQLKGQVINKIKAWSISSNGLYMKSINLALMMEFHMGKNQNTKSASRVMYTTHLYINCVRIEGGIAINIIELCVTR